MRVIVSALFVGERIRKTDVYVSMFVCSYYFLSEHRWFGNIVTLTWWEDLWLNESFATYMQYITIDRFFPEWKIWDDFVRHDVTRALRSDSLHHTHPIHVTVDNPRQIDDLFDDVSHINITDLSIHP